MLGIFGRHSRKKERTPNTRNNEITVDATAPTQADEPYVVRTAMARTPPMSPSRLPPPAPPLAFCATAWAAWILASL